MSTWRAGRDGGLVSLSVCRRDVRSRATDAKVLGIFIATEIAVAAVGISLEGGGGWKGGWVIENGVVRRPVWCARGAPTPASA